MKVGSVILGFIMICIGIVDIAGQAPVLGVHPAVWFILGALLICSDSAWERLSRRKRDANAETKSNSPANGGTDSEGAANEETDNSNS